MSLIIIGALTGSTEIPSVFIGLLCSLNDNTARLQEGHRTETRATATCLTGRFLCLWRKLWTFAGRVSCKMSSDGTSSYLSNEQHKPSCVEVFPLRDWIAAVTSRSGSYFMDAKMGSWSACIKLSSIQGWMIYLRRPIFPPPAHIVSLGTSPSPIQLGNNRAGVTFQELLFHVAFPSWMLSSPWRHLFACLFWGGTRQYL